MSFMALLGLKIEFSQKFNIERGTSVKTEMLSNATQLMIRFYVL